EADTRGGPRGSQSGGPLPRRRGSDDHRRRRSHSRAQRGEDRQDRGARGAARDRAADARPGAARTQAHRLIVPARCSGRAYFLPAGGAAKTVIFWLGCTWDDDGPQRGLAPGVEGIMRGVWVALMAGAVVALGPGQADAKGGRRGECGHRVRVIHVTRVVHVARAENTGTEVGALAVSQIEMA